MRKMFLFLLLIPCLASAQQTTFEIVYGGDGYDEARSIWQTTDVGYIVTGISGSYPSGNSDVFLLKLDSVGAIEWFKFPGGTNLQAGYSVQQTTDGGFIVAGLTDAGGFGGYDVYLMKADMNGDSVWSKTYGGADWDFGYYVEQTTDNGYIIGGTTFSFGKAEQIYLIKTDVNGDTLWTKTHGGSGLESAKCVKQTPDGGYILIGYTTSYGAGEKDIYILKTDANGDSLWSKTYGTENNDEGTFADLTSDGQFIFSGYAENYQNGKVYAVLAKLDNSGNESFVQFIGSPSSDEYPLSVRETPDGGFAYAGYVLGVGAGNKDYRLLKVNAGGNWQWGKTYGGARDEISNSMLVTSDGGFVLAGSTLSYGNGTKEIYIFKSDDQGVSSGNVIMDVNEQSFTNTFNFYPNPADERIYLFADMQSSDMPEFINMSLLDVYGKSVLEKRFNRSDLNTRISVNVQNISSGIYFINLNSKNISTCKKVIIHH